MSAPQRRTTGVPFAVPKTPNGSRYSNVPSSTAKQTPNERRFSVNVTQQAQGTRRSSFFKAPSNAAFKDPRQISSPSFKNEMINKIYDFCQDCHDITKDKIKSPTLKDFINIFEFVYQTFDGNFQLGKVQEEVPRVMRSLGYPVVVKTSYLQSVGAPTAWPHLLALLGWLVDIAKVAQNMDRENRLTAFFLENDETDGQVRSVSYSLESMVFKQYVKDRQAAEANPHFFRDSANRIKNIMETSGTRERKEELENCVKQLTEEVELLAAEPNNCRSLEEDKRKLDADVAKLNEYAEGMRNEVEQKRAVREKAAEKLAASLARATLQKAVLQDAKSKLAEQTARTGVDAAAARTMRQEKQQKELQLQQLTTELEELSRRRYRDAPAASTAFTAAQARARKLLMRVQQLREEILEEKQGNSVDLPPGVRELHSTVSSAGKKMLSETLRELEEKEMTEENARRTEEEERRRAEELQREEEEELARLRGEREMTERRRDGERGGWRAERALLQREGDILRAERDTCMLLSQQVGSFHQAIHAAKQDIQETRNKLHKDGAALDDELSEAVTAVLTRVQNANERRHALLAELSQFAALTH